MKKTKKIVMIIVTVIILLAITGEIILSITTHHLDDLSSIPIEDVDLSTVDDGAYQGSYAAFPVEVSVKVTVKDHMISKIEILKHDNGKGKAAEAITDDVIEAQSLQVDTVSGATYSSLVILLSIEDALNKAINP